MPFNEAHIFVALGKLAFKIKVCNKTSAAYFCVTAVFPTYAVQAAVLRGSANIFVGRRHAAVVLREVAEGLRFDCVRCGSFAILAAYLQFPAVLCGGKTAA